MVEFFEYKEIIEDVIPFTQCVICGNDATELGHTGHLCGASGCSQEDEDKSQN